MDIEKNDNHGRGAPNIKIDERYVYLGDNVKFETDLRPTIVHSIGVVMPIQFTKLGDMIIGHIGMLPAGQYVLSFLHANNLINYPFAIRH